MPFSQPLLTQWLAALLTLVGGCLLASLLGAICGRLARRLNRLRTHRPGDQAASDLWLNDGYIAQSLARSLAPLGWVLSAVLAWRWLPLAGDWLVLGVAKLLITVLLVRLVNRISLRLLQSWIARRDDSAALAMLQGLTPLLRALVWSLGAALYLQNIGVQMAAIWALLSAGGIGAGLALKQPVSEFFDYLTILLDKPFESGQQIQVNGITATVERVGVRSTRLRSLSGEAIVMSNSTLTGSVIANLSDRPQRRLVSRFGVAHSTDVATLERIPALVRGLVERSGASFGRCHFLALRDSSLEFELVYLVDSNEEAIALDLQQRINLELMRCFEQEGITLA